MSNKSNIQKDSINISSGDYSVQILYIDNTPRRHPSPDSDIDYTKRQVKSIHTHFTYEIFFIDQGCLKLVSETFTKDYSKSVVIVPPKFKHISIPIAGESFCLLFSFKKSNNKNIGLESTLKNNITEIPITDEIAYYIEKFATKTEENLEDEAYHLASLIFKCVFRELEADVTNKRLIKNTKANHIGNIEIFINRNINKKITLKDVSDKIYLSQKQISRIIEKEYGCTFSKLLTEKRLAIAELLLKNTDMKISDIATQTFYGTEAYFYTVFKEKYKISPLKYRKMHKK